MKTVTTASPHPYPQGMPSRTPWIPETPAVLNPLYAAVSYTDVPVIKHKLGRKGGMTVKKTAPRAWRTQVRHHRTTWGGDRKMRGRWERLSFPTVKQDNTEPRVSDVIKQSNRARPRDSMQIAQLPGLGQLPMLPGVSVLQGGV